MEYRKGLGLRLGAFLLADEVVAGKIMMTFVAKKSMLGAVMFRSDNQ